MDRSSRIFHSNVVAALACAGLFLVGHASPACAPADPVRRPEHASQRTHSFEKQAITLGDQGKTAEAIQAALAMLAIEREVLGEASEDEIRSHVLLAELHQERADWAAARKSRTAVIELWTKKVGKDSWQAADARSALENVESLSKLNDRDRRRLSERSYQKADEEGIRGRRLRRSRGPSSQELTIRKELQGERHSMKSWASHNNNIPFKLR